MLTVITTTSIKVVLLVSRIFLVSFDSPPTDFVLFVDVLPGLLDVVETILVFNSRSRFLSASNMARNNNMLRTTNARHGSICTNRTRNLIQRKEKQLMSKIVAISFPLYRDIL